MLIPAEYRDYIKPKLVGIIRNDPSGIPFILFSSQVGYIKYCKDNNIPYENQYALINKFELDNQYRTVLPEKFRLHIELKKDRKVSFIGQKYYFAVYSFFNGEKAQKEMEKYHDTLANRKFMYIPL